MMPLFPRILAAYLGLVAGAIADPPNFLFILVDDLGYMDIGANNPDTFYETPNIDQLAREGMRFTDGYAANPVCSPTRYSVMTGKWPSRIDATNFFAGKREGRFRPAPMLDRMPLSEVTMAEALKTKGYRTFFAGKWHLGPTEEFWPERQGFEVNKGGWKHGGPWNGGQYFSPYGNPRLQDGPAGEHLPRRLAQETMGFIEKSKDEPFLAFLSFYSVHTPLMAPESLVEKYQRKAERLGLIGKAEFATEEQVWPFGGRGFELGQAGNSRAPADPGARRVRVLQSHATYAGMVESMDRSVGAVLDKLRSLDIDGKTVVFFTSDNGGLSTSEGLPTSNLPLRGGKGWTYEGGIREPFIIKWPGVAEPGSVSDTPVCSIDFFPTILEIANVDLRHSVDGASLVPLLKGGTISRDALFWHYPHYSNQGGFPSGAIRMGDWKLIERYEDGRTHLYNLGKDLGELNDLSLSEPGRVQAMRKRLHAWYEDVDAKFLRSRDPWRPR